MNIYYSASPNGTDALVLVMKYQNPWNMRLFNKLTKSYHLFIIFAEEVYRASGSEGLSFRIDNAANEIKKANLHLEAVIFDLEFFPFLNFIPVLINTRKKYKTGMLSLDEPYLFNTNVVYASCVDFVLTTCPLAVYKYQEVDIQVEFFFMETEDDYRVMDVEPAYDLVFFGQSVVGSRRKLIEAARSAGINILTSEEFSKNNGGERPELSDFMAMGKLVLNPMRSTHFPVVGNWHWDYIETPVRWYRQHKSRIYETAWSGRYSITEFSPATRLLFSADELPMFNSPEEMVAQVREILADGDSWKTLGLKFKATCTERFGDEVLNERLRRFLRGVERKDDAERNRPVFSSYGFAVRQVELLRRFPDFTNQQMLDREIAIFTNIVNQN